MTKDAHWCCNQCGRAVVKVGANGIGVEQALQAHRKVCLAATFLIKMLAQGS